MTQTNREAATQFLNQAVALEHTEPNLSYKMLVSAIEADPSLAAPWFLLGQVNAGASLKLRPSAIACFRKFLQLDPKNARAWVTLGHTLYHDGQILEAEDATGKAISLDASLCNAWTNLSLIRSVQGDVKHSLFCAQKGYDLDPNPTTEMALGFACLHARELDRGFKHFEAKLSYAHKVFHSFPWPRWQGEDLTDKTLFVLADQGMGDTLDFLRFIPMVAVKCERVVLQIQNEMARMAALMLIDYPNVDITPLNNPLPIADFWVQNTSVPVVLGLSSDEIEHCPQLTIPLNGDDMHPRWKSPDAKLHVGIAWKGNPQNDIDVYRSMPIENFLRFYQVPGIQLYSLQVGQFAPDVHSSGSATLVRDLSPYIRDTLDCSDVMQHLDLVVAIESFVPHLAAAIGKPVFLPYSYLGGDWRIGRKGQRTIWHPTTRVFYQGEDRQWEPVLDEITEALREFKP